MGWRNRGMGGGLITVARVAAAPVVLALALTALPGRTRDAASSAEAVRERAAALATTPEGASVEASLARLLSDPELGRRLDGALAGPGLDPYAREILHAALTVSRTSSALAGRLLGTPATSVDRERLDRLARDLGANHAVDELREAGATLQRQPWPMRLALDRTRATLDGFADVDSFSTAAADSLFASIGDTVAFRSIAGALSRVLADDRADTFVRSLPPLVAAGFLDRPAVDALGHTAPDRGATAATDDREVRLAAALVIVADGVIDGRPEVVATAVTTAIAFSPRSAPAGR